MCQVGKPGPEIILLLQRTLPSQNLIFLVLRNNLRYLAIVLVACAADMINSNSEMHLTAFVLATVLSAEMTFCLSESAREGLKKSLHGVDPEVRRARVKRLADAFNMRNAALHVNSTIPEDTHPTGIITTPPITHGDLGSIVDINREEGVHEYFLDADINLTEEQWSELEAALASDSRLKRQVGRKEVRWTNNVVFYYFDATMSAPYRSLVRKTLRYLSSRTCIKFVENAAAPNRIQVFNGPGCSSSVGMLGGEQFLSLASGCAAMGIIAHEFMHALGVWHMQMRNDRDSFITVDLTNVPESSRFNYEKMKAEELINLTPYEYGSVMHYDAMSFATSGVSMIPADKRYLRTLGSFVVSFYDIKMINMRYRCHAKCGRKFAKCTNGGVPNPRQCQTCICPQGYGGPLCDIRPPGCGETLMATEEWTSYNITLGEITDIVLRDVFLTCNHWIMAPSDTTIQLRISALDGVECTYGCWLQAIEPRIMINKQITNPRICCTEQINEILNSTINPTPIISYNLRNMSTFTFEYRYF